MIEGDAQPTNPQYYTGDVECWDIVYQLHGTAGCLAHILKYAWRAGRKPGVPLATDLQKIVNWCNFLQSKVKAD